MALAEPVTPQWTLGEKIWKARKDAGLEQADVARELGVSRALVSRWERDQSEIGAKKLQDFAQLTGTPIAWLMSTFGYKWDTAGEPTLSLIDGTDAPIQRHLPFDSPLRSV